MPTPLLKPTPQSDTVEERQRFFYAHGQWRYDRKQSGYGGQTKPIFHEKPKTTKRIVLKLECVEPFPREKRPTAALIPSEVAGRTGIHHIQE